MTFMAHTITTVVLFLTISFCASSPVEDHSTSSANLSSPDYVPSPGAAFYSIASSPSRTETTSARRAEGELHDLLGSSSAPPRSLGDAIGKRRRRPFNRKELDKDFDALKIDSTWEPKNILKPAVNIFAKQENSPAATKRFTKLLYQTGVPAEKVKVFQIMRSRERWNNHFRINKNVPSKNAVARPSTKNSNLVRKRTNRSKLLEEARDAELKEFEDKLSAAYSHYGSPSEAEASVRQEYSLPHYSYLQMRRKRKTQLEGPASDAPSLARAKHATQHRDHQLQQLSVPRKKTKVLSSSATVPPAPSSEAKAPPSRMRPAYPSRLRAQQTSSRDIAASPSDKQALHDEPRLLATWTNRKPRSATQSTRLADTVSSSPSAPSLVRPPQPLLLERFGASVDKPAVESPKPPTKLQLRPVQVSKKQFRGHQSPGASSRGAGGRSEDGRKPSDAPQKSSPAQGERPTVGAKRYRAAERPTVGAKRYRAAEGHTPNSQVSRGQVATITVAGYKRPLPVHAGP